MNKRMILTAIEHARQCLEHAVREDNHARIDEVWAQLVQLYVALADLEIEELFKRGA